MAGLASLLPRAELVLYMVNLGVAVSLVCGVGLLAARAWRRDSAPWRHGILVATLVLVLVSPLAVRLAQQNGLALIQITVGTQGEADRQAAAADVPQAATVLPSRSAIQRELESRELAEVDERRHEPVAPRFRAGPVVVAAEADTLAPPAESPPPVVEAVPLSEPFFRPAWWQVVGSVVAVLWGVGMLLGLCRLACGYAALVRFCRRLDPLREPGQKLLVHQAADAVGLRRLPAVYVSRVAEVPVSIGLMRPAIVLPAAMSREADREQLLAVLLHEAAHIARGDHWVGVAQRVAAMLFWWNPLVHWVGEEISELREEICDNYVVLVQGEGQGLARLLLDLAARVSAAPLLPSTVGVMEPRLAGLTGRVTRLLDKERNMETRMNVRAKVLLLSCSLTALMAIATVGGMRLAQGQPASEAASAAPAQAVPVSPDAGALAGGSLGSLAGEVAKPAARPDVRADRFDFRGRVLDPEGKPLQDAKIYFVFYTNHTHAKTEPPKMRAITGPDGEFRFRMDTSEFEAWRAGHPWGVMDDVNFRNDCRLVAQAQGYGPVWLPAFAFERTGELRKRILQTHPRDVEAMSQAVQPVLRVVKDDVPLVGRIIDLQGQPVAGVKVRVLGIELVKKEDLTDWLNVAQRKDADVVQTLDCMSRASVPGGSFGDEGMSSSELPQIMPTALSDAQGKLRLTGIGRERIVALSIEGPGIESAVRGFARTRPGPTLSLPYQRPWAMEKCTYHGATFEHVARPSVPIVGTVRDKDTGKPLPGVTIQAHKLAGNPGRSLAADYYYHTTSDAQGRYTLTGMPIGKDNELLALPPLDQPYLPSKAAVDTTGKKDSVQSDFALKRGIWIRGKVSDAKTGAPVPNCIVDYYVFLSNPHHKSAPGFRGACEVIGRHETGKDGLYAIPGLPGRGIVAVEAYRDAESRYVMGSGAERIRELRQDREQFEQVAPGTLYAYRKQALREVNLAEDAKSLQLDLPLDPGQTLAVAVLDPEGKPLAGAHCQGGTELGHWLPLNSDRFTVNCYQPDKPRELYFVHLERKLAGSLVVKGAQAGPLRVQLQPWGTVAGRLVDGAGKPLGDVEIKDDKLPRHLLVKTPEGVLRRVLESHRTDANGRFRIEGLAPGIEYNVSVWDPRSGKYLAVNLFAVTVERGQTKDVRDVTCDAALMRRERLMSASLWQMNVKLEAPNLVPAAIQFVVLDKDPVPGVKATIQRTRTFYRQQLEGAKNKAMKGMARTSQMTVAWELGFRDITADKVYLLTPVGPHAISSNGPAGKKWIVSKTVKINGKPTCWCIPVEVEMGKLIEVTLTEDNVFDLDSVYNKEMQDSAPAK